MQHFSLAVTFKQYFLLPQVVKNNWTVC